MFLPMAVAVDMAVVVRSLSQFAVSLSSAAPVCFTACSNTLLTTALVSVVVFLIQFNTMSYSLWLPGPGHPPPKNMIASL